MNLEADWHLLSIIINISLKCDTLNHDQKDPSRCVTPKDNEFTIMEQQENQQVLTFKIH